MFQLTRQLLSNFSISLVVSALFFSLQLSQEVEAQSSNSLASLDALEARVLGEGSESPAEASPNETSLSDVLEEADQATLDVDLDKLEELNKSTLGSRGIPKSHIFVVQNRYVKKAMRHEINAFRVGIQPADSFNKQFEWGVGYTFHFSELIGLEVFNLSLIKNFDSGLGNQLSSSLSGLSVLSRNPKLSLTSAIHYTPFVSKAAAEKSIHYFEGYLLAGGGLTQYDAENVSHFAGGLGFRVYLSRSSLLRFEFRDLIDFKTGGSLHRFNISFGFGVLLGDLK